MNKKVLVALGLIVVSLMMVVPAFAKGATKFTFDQRDAASDTESGFVVINAVKDDKTIIVVQVRGMDIDAQDNYWVYYLTPNAPPSVVLGPLKLNKFGSGHLIIELDYTIPTGTPGSGTYAGIEGYHFGISNVDTAPVSANVVLHTYVPAQ